MRQSGSNDSEVENRVAGQGRLWTPRERVVIARMENISEESPEIQVEVRELEHDLLSAGDEDVSVSLLADFARDGRVDRFTPEAGKEVELPGWLMQHDMPKPVHKRGKWTGDSVESYQKTR